MNDQILAILITVILAYIMIATIDHIGFGMGSVINEKACPICWCEKLIEGIKNDNN